MSSADAIIVIFGAAIRRDGRPSLAVRRRVKAAFDFGLGLGSPRYVPTGGVGQFGASEASVMGDLLRGYGVAPERIVLEETATDTVSSVRAVVRLLRERAIAAPVYAATSGYHLPRCVLLLRLAGVAALACPPPPAAEGWRDRWYWRLREAAALPYDAALMLGLRVTGRV